MHQTALATMRRVTLAAAIAAALPFSAAATAAETIPALRLADALPAMSRASPEGAVPWVGKKAVVASSLPSGGGPVPFGASDTLFSEDFSGYDRSQSVSVLPGPEFVLHNVDGLAPAASVNYVNAAWVVREDFSFHAGGIDCVVNDCAAFSTSWYSPAGTANDWIVLPQVTPTSGTRLSWNAVTYDASYREGYEVRVSTAGTAPADFTQILFSTAAEEPTWTSRDLSLAAYAGQPIRVAFRNNSTDKFLLLIDDLVIKNVVNADPALLGFSPIQYTRVPVFLGLALPLAAQVRNEGLQALTNVIVDADILLDDVAVDSLASLPLATLAPAATATVNLDPLLVDAVGVYSLEATVSAQEGDQLPANSSIERVLVEGTLDDMARDSGIVSGSLGIGAGNGGELGQHFDVDVPIRMESAFFVLNLNDVDPDDGGPLEPDGVAEHAGRTITVNLRGWDEITAKPGEIIAIAQVQVPQDAAPGVQEFTAHFPPHTLLPASRFVLTVAEEVGAPTMVLAQTNDVFTPVTTWVNWPTSPAGGWANNELFGAGFAKSYVLRPVFAPPVLAPSAVDDSFSVVQDGVLNGSVAGNDQVSDFGTHVYSVTDAPSSGALSLETDGSFEYTPNALFNGTDTFEYSLCDAEQSCDAAVVTITVQGLPIFADGFESP